MTATATPPAVSPVEYVLGLPVEHQEEVFLALVEKLLKVCEGEGKIPIHTPDGRSLGYLTPPHIEAEQREAFFANLTPMEKEWLANPIGPIDWDDCLSKEEIDELIRDVFRGEGSKSPEPNPRTPPPSVPSREIAR
jgi:hypothetical protein